MFNLIMGQDGRRKYLTDRERDAILTHASTADEAVYTFCSVLAATGCRISEALTLRMRNIDIESQSIIIECLKKRRRGIYRAVPVPSDLISLLVKVHNVSSNSDVRLWPWSRMTAWRKINGLMDTAGIKGLQATPKGFRHGFGVTAIESGVPLNMVQKWLGHSDLRTTAIYTSAIGREELSIAERMWRKNQLFNKI
ncbi:site-specific integrase [Sphingobium sp. B11D3A]|uniref:tyrosine-type recombinase/integrase n=1 Tax=Sphingobium sp. B11D3A TaxID=2940574 RepID=UPI0029CABE54|nr:site-specific integrase [Sphingobium sp. B11D3A]MCW2393538.1 integrase [Sphingobium sp. B11D3A]